MTGSQRRRVRVDDIELSVVTSGPTTGRPVVLLHGFPDFSYGWRHQIDALAERGYRVIVPDQRGHGLSDKPRAVGAYAIDHLQRDVLALMDALDVDRASLIGHDFGGAIAWWIAANHPARLDRLIVLNCPHFSVYRRAHLHLDQLMRSWYVAAFMLPRIAEAACAAANFHVLRFGPGGRIGRMGPTDMARYLNVWSQPGAMRAMLSWYRAMIPILLRPFPATRIVAPTLLLWGMQDAYLTHRMARPSMDYCDHGRLEYLADATHWLHWDAPEHVNERILHWLDDGGRVAASAGPS